MLFLMIYFMFHYHQAIEFLEKNIIINFYSGQAQVLRPACSFQHYWLKLIELDEL